MARSFPNYQDAVLTTPQYHWEEASQDAPIRQESPETAHRRDEKEAAV
jgi:hypothetical protein